MAARDNGPPVAQGGHPRDLLRFITCGSVDDGKSTLIGRLLHDSGQVFDDQLEALAIDSARAGTQGANLDYALLLDGLAAEREQGITIDVAYRYFATRGRKFIVADTPGHAQYTRNMVTGASTADLAVLLVDARHGVATQTRRHAHLVHLLGIRHLVLAVNKMDLVEYGEARFAAIEAEFAAFARDAGIARPLAIPLAALAGVNVARRSTETPWYAGPSLVEHLESVEIDADRAGRAPFRLPVQWVNRPHADFRGFAGRIASGVVRPGDPVTVLPSGVAATVARIVTFDGDLDAAGAGQSVTLTLAQEVDVGRGDVIAAQAQPPEVADQFEATLIWMADAPLLPGRRYWLMLGARLVGCQVTELKYALNVDTQEHVAAKSLELNAIAVANIALDAPVAFEPYARSRALGGFILIDRESNATVGAGLIHFALRRSHNLHWQALDVTRAARAAMNGHRSAVLWFTGLSGAGKSTIANLVEKRLHSLGRRTYTLDGDNVRHGLNRDLGFTDADRVENIRRVAEVARLMVDAGLIVITSFISPFRAERAAARARFAPGDFWEVFVDTPLEVAEARDPKGLYAKARAGELANFTGIGSAYEPPLAPELRVDTTAESPAEAAERIVAGLLGDEVW